MSNSDVGGRTTYSRDDLYQMLADETRRHLLRLVADRSPTGIEKTDLAFELAAVMNDKRLATVTDDEYQRAQIDCHHRSLPALVEAGLLDIDDEDVDGRVRTTDHWAFDDPDIAAVIEGRTAESSEDLDALFGALADERRRTILRVLGNQYHPISTATLARDVAARADGTPERALSQDRVDAVYRSLVHVHLPTLSEADLIGYDASSGRVSYEGHPLLRVSWLGGGEAQTRFRNETETEDVAVYQNVAPDGEPRTDRNESTTRTTDVQTLDGRETIVTTGQSLCERAEDELFVLFTTTELLEAGCFRRIEDALDRGVGVYLGSPDPRVREIVAERAPEVVVWEPQLNWINRPSEGDSVGRLVFADREAVLLGTVGPSNPRDDTDESIETAILGEGEDNGLVVTMRQLLGSRLDRLEARNDVQSEIPL